MQKVGENMKDIGIDEAKKILSDCYGFKENDIFHITQKIAPKQFPFDLVAKKEGEWWIIDVKGFNDPKQNLGFPQVWPTRALYTMKNIEDEGKKRQNISLRFVIMPLWTNPEMGNPNHLIVDMAPFINQWVEGVPYSDEKWEKTKKYLDKVIERILEFLKQ